MNTEIAFISILGVHLLAYSNDPPGARVATRFSASLRVPCRFARAVDDVGVGDTLVSDRYENLVEKFRRRKINPQRDPVATALSLYLSLSLSLSLSRSLSRLSVGLLIS